VDVTRQDLTLKVADFGMARVNTIYTAHRDTPFPVKWSAPEGMKTKRRSIKIKKQKSKYLCFIYLVLLYHKYSSKSGK
jgi:Protein tyrosine and serine/threonine kinase